MVLPSAHWLSSSHSDWVLSSVKTTVPRTFPNLKLITLQLNYMTSIQCIFPLITLGSAGSISFSSRRWFLSLGSETHGETGLTAKNHGNPRTSMKTKQTTQFKLTKTLWLIEFLINSPMNVTSSFLSLVFYQ